MTKIWKCVALTLVALVASFNLPTYEGRAPIFWFRPAVAAYTPAGIGTVPSVSSLTTTALSNWPVINLTSYIAGKGKGGGLFYLNTSDTTSATDYCTIFVDSAGNRFYRMSGDISAFGCGALGDNVSTTDAVALQHCLDAVRLRGTRNFYQGAPGGICHVQAGTYQLAASTPLTFGPTTAGPTYPNVSTWLQGEGQATVLNMANAGTGCAINMWSVTARTTISDMTIVANGGGGSCDINVRGNGQLIKDVWLDAITGIAINGATDVKISKVLCDQCQGSPIGIYDVGAGISHHISISQVEPFGGNLQTNTSAIACDGAHYSINVTGLIVNYISGIGVIVKNGCQMSLSDYEINAVNNTIGAASTQYGIDVEANSFLNLGAGTITGFQSSGLHINGGTVNDNGANIISNVQSLSADNRYEVFVENGNYYKGAGTIAGGSGKENGLVFALCNAAGNLTISGGAALNNSAGAGVVVQGTISPCLSLNIVGVDFYAMNGTNSAANTPIAVTGSGVNAINISDNTITPSFAVTNAITIASGAANITNNLSHFGAFPSTAGGVVSTNNRNF